jgi:hypothetical protein
VIKDFVSLLDTQLSSHALTAGLYHRVAALTASILEQLKPLPKRFGLEKTIVVADDYANAALDFLEQKVPAVKSDTKELVGRARQPADQAYEVAQGYKNGIQQVRLFASFSPFPPLVDGRGRLLDANLD